MKNFSKFVVIVLVLVFAFSMTTFAKKGKDVKVAPATTTITAAAIVPAETETSATGEQTVELTIKTNVVALSEKKSENFNGNLTDGKGNTVGTFYSGIPQKIEKNYSAVLPKKINLNVNVMVPTNETVTPTTAPTAVVETKTVTLNTPSARKEMFQICFGIIYSAEVSDSLKGFEVDQKMGDNFGQASAQWNMNEYSSARYTYNTGDYKRAAGFNRATFGEESVKTTHRVDLLYYPIPKLTEIQPFFGAGVEWLNITNPLSAAGTVLKDDYSPIVLGFTGGIEMPLLNKLFVKFEVSCFPYKITTDMLGATMIYTKSDLTFSAGIGFKFL